MSGDDGIERAGHILAEDVRSDGVAWKNDSV